MGAGMVATRRGLSWNSARAFFDLYQGYKTNGFSTIHIPGSPPILTVIPVREAPVSVKAEAVGYARGIQRFKR